MNAGAAPVGLEVDGLTCVAGDGAGAVTLLDQVSLSVAPGEVVGLIGESGSGKTMASLALLGVLPDGVRMTAGTVSVGGHRIRPAPGRHGLAAIFQNPRDALNPTMRVGSQMARVLRRRPTTRPTAHVDTPGDTPVDTAGETRGDTAAGLLRRCGVPGADKVLDLYPHQLSGGMCQRVMVAMAIASRPSLLVADEPTTALDMTVQAQIIDLLRDVVADTGCGVLLITHDLGVVAELCDRVVVLLGGRVMERAEVGTLFDHPRHPYTRFLLDPRRWAEEVPGHVEHPSDRACPFIGRCPAATAACDPAPELRPIGEAHDVACVAVQQVMS